MDVKVESKEPDFIPNFKRYPEFHYSHKSLYSESSPPVTQTVVEPQNVKTNEINSSSKNNHSNTPTKSELEIVTIKVRTNLDEDFVEIDIDPSNTSFEVFKNICIREFDYVEADFDKLRLHRVKKLPNVLIRNTNDVKRLKNDQSVEFYFLDKNTPNLI